MRSDLTCPVEITGVSIERAGEGIVCVIDFVNLSEKKIESIQMNILCFDGTDSRLGGRLVRSRVEGAPNAAFSGTFAPDHVEATVRVEASVEKIWYGDGVVWRREEKNVREYEPNWLPSGQELDRLRRVAGEDARGYARMDDKVWMCVCGRANMNSSDICMRCGRQRAFVLAHYSFEVIDATEGFRERTRQEKSREALQANAQQQEREEKTVREREKKKRKRIVALIAVLLVLALGLSAYRWSIPMFLTARGDALRASGKPADAKRFYEIVERYWPDAFSVSQKLIDAENDIMDSMIADGSEVALREAATRAERAGDAARLLRAQLALADVLIARGEEKEAEAILRRIERKEEAMERLCGLLYDQGMRFKEKVDYPEAIAKFAEAGEYRDASQQKNDCIYLYGRQLVREGNYEDACAQFEMIPAYEDSVSLLRNSRYLLAGKLRLEGKLTEAAGYYESLGFYEDAAECALACHYEAGVQAQEAGDLPAAAGQFALAAQHEDAEKRFEACAEILAENAIEEEDWESAIGWLSRLPREQVQTKLDAAVYAWAEELLQEGRKEEAAVEFASLGGYEDAASRVQAIEYEIATREMEESPEEAMYRFEGLRGYMDSDQLARQCRIRNGQARMDAGDYEGALEMFEGITARKERETYIRQCRYAWAEICAQDEKYEESAKLYELCGAYLDAEEKARNAHYQSALSLESSGEYAAAAAAFDALGGYSDAKAAKERCEDARLKEPFVNAQMDLDVGNYLGAIETLEPYLKETHPTRYAGIRTVYESACLGLAQELIGLRRPLEALPYLERIPDNRSAAKRLNDYVYRIIGRWKDTYGTEYLFRKDGSCRIGGEDAFFNGNGYEIDVGPQPNPTEVAYTVVSLRGSTLTLKRKDTGKNVRLTYLGSGEDEAFSGGNKAGAESGEDASSENTSYADTDKNATDQTEGAEP